MALMKECVPTSFDSKQLSELQGFAKAFNALDAGMWGSCEGACYVRQVRMRGGKNELGFGAWCFVVDALTACACSQKGCCCRQCLCWLWRVCH